ncbi:hypothetical protein [Pseudooceanicola marinus]|uniref:hypothetical protein n=1 Tax=Pseudooceanicola marinus TaxID=396013 RepID=UPI000A26FE02|nr:hypothetical protein [Pseudooceanicola marinus]PJE27343.1 hypothetical protein CVM50_16995 [Pseudooceanicola marinus]
MSGRRSGLPRRGGSHVRYLHWQSAADLAEEQRFIFPEDEDDLREHIFDIVAILQDGYRIADTIKPKIRLVSRVFLQEIGEVTWCAREYVYTDGVQLLTDANIDQIELRDTQIFAAVREADHEADDEVTRAISETARSVRANQTAAARGGGLQRTKCHGALAQD